MLLDVTTAAAPDTSAVEATINKIRRFVCLTEQQKNFEIFGCCQSKFKIPKVKRKKQPCRGPTPMELSPSNDPDGVGNLQATVLLALSKLSKNWKNPRRRYNGVSCKSIAEFLKANYSWIDGDIESQVMTTLLSCIKTGLVCALVSGRYRLIGAAAKDMATNCILRPSHGPKCSCLNMLKCFSKSYSQICCFLEKKEATLKRKRLCKRKKALVRVKSPSPKVIKRRCGKPGVSCVRSTKMFTTGNCPEGKNRMALRSRATRSLCLTCFPLGKPKGLVHYEGFSPGEELSSEPIAVEDKSVLQDGKKISVKT